MAPFCVFISNNVANLSQAVICWWWAFLELPVCSAGGGGGGGGCTGLGEC